MAWYESCEKRGRGIKSAEPTLQLAVCSLRVVGAPVGTLPTAEEPSDI